jgi:hypothetical protein
LTEAEAAIQEIQTQETRLGLHITQRH